MHEVQIFCYLGAGMLVFIFSGISIKCVSYFCNRINRQSQAASGSAQSATDGSGYREVIAETASSKVEVVVETSSTSTDSDEAGSNINEKNKECLNNCMICICEIEDGDVCWELTACNHRFHADCIQRWMKRSKSCPLCRRTVTIVHTK